MRARSAALAVATLLVSCTGGDGIGDRAADGPTSTSPGPGSVVTSTTASGPSTTAPTVASTTDPPGSVTFRATRLALPAGHGLRVLVRAASARMTVRRQGGAGVVAVCPVSDASTPPDLGGCADLTPGREVDVAATRGVELRGGTGGGTVDEVAVRYVPVDRSMTLVTPARTAGGCSAAPCEAAFTVSPPRAGAFTLDGRAGGGRPRLTLWSVGPGAAQDRVLATVEGGGALSIRATLEAAAEARLLYRELIEGAVGPHVLEIVWP